MQTTSALNLNKLSATTLRRLCEATGFLTGPPCEMIQALGTVEETVLVRVLAKREAKK